METFRTLFGSLLGWVYHCFNRIVIQGYLPLLTRPEHLVHFFRDVHQIFGVRKHRRLRGKFQTMLEKLDHGHPCCGSSHAARRSMTC